MTMTVLHRLRLCREGDLRQSDEQTSDRASLRRPHQLTSVCFAATAGP